MSSPSRNSALAAAALAVLSACDRDARDVAGPQPLGGTVRALRSSPDTIFPGGDKQAPLDPRAAAFEIMPMRSPRGSSCTPR